MTLKESNVMLLQDEKGQITNNRNEMVKVAEEFYKKNVQQ